MDGYTQYDFYELICNNERFSFLQYIRKDIICDVCYLTFKNAISGETISFDTSEIRRVQMVGEEANAS